MVGFIDLAPTVLSLVGIEPPESMQGGAFCGQYAAPEPQYQHGFRGRMDERYDLVRVVRDKRWIYLRHYMPHEIYGQHIDYMFKTPTTRVWKELFEAGKLDEKQSRFWQRKPPEELYDLDADPDEVVNLATSGEHREVLERFREVQRRQVFEIRDVGFLPEDEIHRRSEGSTPYAMGHDEQKYPLQRILGAAETASFLDPDAVSALRSYLRDEDSAVRYWGAMGLLMRETLAVAAARQDLLRALEDESPSVRAVAAEALARFGEDEDLPRALATLADLADARRHGLYVALLALNAIDALGVKAKPLADELAKLPRVPEGYHRRLRNYTGRLLGEILGRLQGD